MLSLLQCVVLWKEFHQQPQQRLRMLYPLISQAGQGKREPKLLEFIMHLLDEMGAASFVVSDFIYVISTA